ncbi:MAG: tetratricopeptide repeat protein [Planctomycetes bacterium]|nr:tetratricopeptide repeat protein [Planctomycetota bacterium]MBL7042742.1 tetratricopeptide repeat protein [Pirellulaceae bacterium]
MNADDERTIDFRDGGSTNSPRGKLAITDESGLRIRCPQCHQPIEVVTDDLASDILCSTCGSNFSLVDDVGATYKAAALRSIEHFELVDRVGVGAFGAVWKARDSKLDRTVAIKVPRKGELSREETEQFLREARAAAQLRHPNIVGVHEVGRDGDTVYMVTDFVRGVTLDDWLSGQEFSQREGVELCAKIADALHHAHEKGVIHRDVKPGNIMLDYEGEPYVMDFGLAKREVGELTMTVDGRVLGTPAYMSPEQASGDAHQADRRSDTYSLGVVLYRLLTGELPFRGNTRMLVLQIINEEPASLRKLNGHVSRDLETITLKCLEKSPERRYASAGELGKELRRYLRGEPILARPIGRTERLWRWAKRNPRVAALSTAILLLLIAASLGSMAAALRINKAKDQAEANEAKARRAETSAILARDELADALQREQDALRVAGATVTDMYTSQGLAAAERGASGDAVLWFANAANAAIEHPDRRQANLVRMASWSHLTVQPIHALPDFVRRAYEIGFHPGGRYFMALASGGTCIIWDLERDEPVALEKTGVALVRSARWSHDGKWLALGATDGSIRLVTFPELEPAAQFQLDGSVYSLAFDRADQLVAAGSKTVRVWSCADGEPVSEELVHPAPVMQLAFSSNSAYLATAGADEMVRVFAVDNEEQATAPLFDPVPHVRPRFHSTQLVKPIFLDDDRKLLTLSGESEITIRDAVTGEQMSTLPVSEHIHAITPDPFGRYLAICENFAVRLWDSADNRMVGLSMRHANRVLSVAFSPDGVRLLTAGIDSMVYQWSLPSGQKLGSGLEHQNELSHVAFSPNGMTFATAQRDGLVRIWRQPDSGAPHQPVRIGADEYLTVSPDGRFVMPAGWNLNRNQTSTQVFELATGEAAGATLETAGLLNGAAFSPDGRCVVTLSSDKESLAKRGWMDVHLDRDKGWIEFWNWRTGKQQLDPLEAPSEPKGAAFSPDGKILVVVCGGGQVLLVDAESGEQIRQLQQPGKIQISLNTPEWVRFVPPDGRLFVTYGFGAGVQVWEADSGKLVRSIPQKSLSHVDFSEDGKLIVTASRDNTARVWQVEDGKPAGPPLEHSNWVFRARLSRDQRYVLTACRDHMARLWDWRSGKLVGPAMEHEDEVFDAAFHADERWVLTAGRDRTIRFWEGSTGQPIAPQSRFTRSIHQVYVTPDGKHAVAPTSSLSFTVFTLGHLTDPGISDAILDVRTIGEVVAGRRVIGGGVTNLTTDEWREAWRKLREATAMSDPNVVSSRNRQNEHRRESHRLLKARQWSAALWHIERSIALGMDDWQAYYDRGFTRYSLKEHKAAVEDFGRALELNPEHTESYHFRAHAQMNLDNFGPALKDVNETISRDPDRAHFFTMRGDCHRQLGRLREAFDDYAQADRLQPPHDSGLQRAAMARYLGLLAALRAEEDDKTTRQVLSRIHVLGTSLAEQDPNDIHMYNMACVCALLASLAEETDETATSESDLREEHQDRAVQWLRKAFAAGYDDIEHMEADSDLEAVRSYPGYQALLKELRD